MRLDGKIAVGGRNKPGLGDALDFIRDGALTDQFSDVFEERRLEWSAGKEKLVVAGPRFAYY